MASLNEVMRAHGSQAAQIRTTLNLTGLDTADAHLIQADSVCAHIELAFTQTPTTPAPHIVVYRLGTQRYAVFSPGPVHTAVFFIDDRNRLLLIIQ
jgi:hypothetical protein